MYIEGFKGAKSSLTVPLIFHDQVIGTFNVESPEPRAFSESDLQFLEIFSRDIAVALNTLELMVAQRASTAQESVEAIHGAVALPVDEILNDAVNVMERYIGHEPDVAERLHRILSNARDIKQVIQKVGQSLAPAEARPSCVRVEPRAALVGKHVLVVDADDSVRKAAHALLDRYNCIVETAHDGNEAIFMTRNLGKNGQYDAIILAAAGLERLGFDDRIVSRLMAPEWLPAVSQGAIGIECLSKRQDVIEALAVLNDHDTWQAVQAERALNAGLEGSCSVAIGAYAQCVDDEVHIQAAVFSPDGEQTLQAQTQNANPIVAGTVVANTLLAAGAKTILDLAN